MDIAWFGHAAFRLRGRDAAIVTDPCPSSTGISLGRPQADILTISNPAPQHAWRDGVAGKPVPLDAPGEYEIRSVLIAGVTTALAAHDEQPPGRNVAFVITLDDVVIAHLGDLGHLPDHDQAEELSRADVMLVPVGGRGHLDAALAARVVGTLEPKLVIPMLYRARSGTADLDRVEPFLKELGAELPAHLDNHVSVTPGSLPGHTTVHMLAPRGG